MTILFLLQIFLCIGSLSASQYNDEESKKLFEYVRNANLNNEDLATEEIEKFKNAGANINAYIEYNNCISIMQLFFGNRTALSNIKTLINHGADIQAKDLTYNHSLLRSLLCSKFSDNISSIEGLLTLGADANEHLYTPAFSSDTTLRGSVNNAPFHKEYSTTPLILCTYHHNLYHRIASILLEHGADVNAKDSEENTALHAIIHKSNKILYEHQASLRSSVERSQLNFDPVYRYISHLINYGIKVNTQNNDGATPLEIARYSNLDEVFTHLLHHCKANPLMPISNYDTRTIAYHILHPKSQANNDLQNSMRKWFEEHKDNYKMFRMFKHVMYDQYLCINQVAWLPDDTLRIIFKHLNYPWRYEDQIDPDNFDIEKYK